MDFASDADRQDFIALRGLIKHKDGLWKSEKQANFQMNRARDDRDFLKSNFGLTVADDQKVLFVTALFQWAGNRQSRGMVPQTIAFVIDMQGIVAQYTIGGNGNLKQGWKPNPEKCKLKWSRQTAVNPDVVATSTPKENKMNDLYPTYSHTQFTYHSDLRRFTADASELKWTPGDCEVTFYLQGKKGKMLFSLKEASEEGYLFVMSKAYARDNPDIADVTVFIFND